MPPPTNPKTIFRKDLLVAEPITYTSKNILIYPQVKAPFFLSFAFPDKITNNIKQHLTTTNSFHKTVDEDVMGFRKPPSINDRLFN